MAQEPSETRAELPWLRRVLGQGTGGVQPAFAQMRMRQERSSSDDPIEKSRCACVPAWCQPAIPTPQPVSALSSSSQRHPGLYPKARVSICISLSQHTALFCRGNKLSVGKMRLRQSALTQGICFVPLKRICLFTS